jgi:tetratricopeptide (TPR) repeat protein
MYFENLSGLQDELNLGEMATNLLITDLSESEHLKVVSSQRLYDILKQLDKEGEKSIDKDIATAIAKKSQAKWMLTGNIIGIESRLIISSQIVEVATGQVIKGQKVEGKTGDDVFDLIDELTVKIKQDLSLPEIAIKEDDPSICEITTCSAEAYSNYLKGVEKYNQFYLEEAENYFRAALDFDSEFAMAYYGLAKLESTRAYLGQTKTKSGSDVKRLISRAVKFSDRASAKERFYINSYSDRLNGRHLEALSKLRSIILTYPDEKDAFFGLAQIFKWSIGNTDSAIYYFKKVLEIDPYHKNTYNQLAYTYDRIGEFDKSIWAIGNYISLAPEEPNPYMTKAEIQLSNNKLSDARATLQSVLQIVPDLYEANFRIGYTSAFMQDYDAAKYYFEYLTTSDNQAHRSINRLYLSLLYTLQGKYNNALVLLDSLIKVDEEEGIKDFFHIEKHILKSYVLLELGQSKIVKQDLTNIENLLDGISFDFMVGKKIFDLILINLKLNNFDVARKANKKLKNKILALDEKYLFHYWFSSALIEFYNSEYKDAVRLLEKVRNDGIYWTTYIHYPVHYYLGRSYFEMGEFDTSIDIFESIVSKYGEGRYFYNIISTTSHYYLGQAYEKEKQFSKALNQYRVFLDLWKDADEELKQKYRYKEIKDRISKLETQI